MHFSQHMTKLYCTNCNQSHDHTYTLNGNWRCVHCACEKRVSESTRLKIKTLDELENNLGTKPS